MDTRFKKFYKRIILIAVFLLPLMAFAQEGAKKDKEQEPKTSRSQRREAKKQWKEQRRNERLEKKKIKDHHKRIQTKTVRKRMKSDKKEAQRNQDHKREFFLKRWFSKG
jgi:hypothetical protein